MLSSNLDSFLKAQLNFLRGVEDTLSNRRVINWITEGSDREDDPGRFLNHFHNPLRSWDQAGLHILGLKLGESSILWGQRPELQPSDERFTWQDARENFFKALTFQGLTEKTQGKRDEHLALTFRALGHLIHLVQDAAVPAHTRNDPHPIHEGFEDFVETTGIGQPDSRRFDPSILGLPPNSLAPIPIARIIDTTDPEQPAALPSAGTNIGLAEYSNANFLSGDTIFKDFAFPRVESLGTPVDGNEPGTSRPRRYFTKVADGQTGFRLVAEGTFTERLISRLAGDRGFILDRGVYTNYASLLLPRAIGYSAGLLDYFFRGRIEIAPPQRFVYGLAQFLEGNTGKFTKLRFQVRNASLEEETGPGQLIAVVQYRTPAVTGVNLIEQPGFPPSAQLSFAVSAPQFVPLTRSFRELVFDFTDSPIPTNSADLFLTVVYQGSLGLEQDAVLVGGKDLFEPDPVDIANVTDYFCFNGTLFNVGNLNVFPPFPLLNPPNPITNPHPRDVNRDGAPDLFGPIDEFGIFTKVSRFFTRPSVENFDFQVAARKFPQYTRFLILQDQPFYVLSRLAETLVERGLFPNQSSFNSVFAVLSEGIINRLRALPGGFIIHEFDNSFIYRGVITLGITLFIPQSVPSFLPCLATSFTVTPNLTRIEGTLADP